MEKARQYDLFLSHAWRFHDDWNQLAERLDKAQGLSWRNFSLPWHDPAMNANTPVGGKFIRQFLESQIKPVHCVVFLAGVYEIKSARTWLDMEVEMARKHHKPIIAVPAIGKDSVPDEVSALCDAATSWDTMAFLATLDEVCSVRQ